MGEKKFTQYAITLCDDFSKYHQKYCFHLSAQVKRSCGFYCNRATYIQIRHSKDYQVEDDILD